MCLLHSPYRVAKTADLPIGIEAPLEGKGAPKTIAVEIRNSTVRNILDAVTDADPRYAGQKLIQQ